MHVARTRTRLTAWLGLVAMVLLLVAPMVSQALAPHALRTPFEQAMPMCEAQPAAGTQLPADHHAACAYCDLLAQHVLAPTIVPPLAVFAPVYVSAWTAAPGRLAASAARHAARPRDSPFLT